MFYKSKIGYKFFLVAFFSFFSLTNFAIDTTSRIDLSGDIFKNINAKGIISGAEFSWLVDYDQIDNVENIIIQYQKKVEKGKGWKYSPVIDSKSTSFKIEGMSSGEKYVWKIGCLKDGSDIKKVLKNGVPQSEDLVWSGKGKFKTLRDWGLYKFLVLLGSLGLFIFGMKLMSEGLQQSDFVPCHPDIDYQSLTFILMKI